MHIGNRRGYLKTFGTVLTALAGVRTLFGQLAYTGARD
jgi:hypothetical protein